MTDDRPDPLAERLCAAWISCQLRIGLDYALKNYVRPNPNLPGDFWYAIAKAIRAEAWQAKIRGEEAP